jgi:hypothetical protein
VTALLAKGYVYQSASNFFALAQYHTDGSLDATFGTNGGISIDFGHGNNLSIQPGNGSLLIQADGRIVISESANFASGTYAGYNFALARLWP